MRKFIDMVQLMQQTGNPVCPRCGRDNMKLPIHTNALSRHAKCYVCDDCGIDEALRDFGRCPLPENEWYLWRLLDFVCKDDVEDVNCGDCQRYSGYDEWNGECSKHGEVSCTGTPCKDFVRARRRDMRYRLQRRETISIQCVIGNHLMPLPSYRWKDIAGSDNLGLLREHAKGMNPKTHRIEDTKDGSVIPI